MPESGAPSAIWKNPRVIGSVLLLGSMLTLLTDGLFRHGLFDQFLWTPIGYRALAVTFLITFSIGFLCQLFFPARLIPVVFISLVFYATALLGVGAVATVSILLLASLCLGSWLFERFHLQKIYPYNRKILFALHVTTGLAMLTALVQVAVHWPVNYTAVYLGVIVLVIVWRAKPVKAILLELISPALDVQEYENRFALGCSWGLLIFAITLNFIAACKPEVGHDALAIHMWTSTYFIAACKPEVGHDALAIHMWTSTYIKNFHSWPFEVTKSLISLMPKAGTLANSIAYLIGGEFASRLLNLTFLTLTSWIIYEYLLLKIGRTLANLLLAVYLSTPVVGLVSGSIFQEHFWTLMLLAATFIATAKTDSFKGRWIVVSLFLALALATKMMFIFTLPAFIGLFFWQANKEHRPKKETGLAFGICFLVIGVIGGWPYWVSLWKTGNPVFPFMNHFFRSPYYSTAKFEHFIFQQPVSFTLLYDLTFHSNKSLQGLKGTAGFQWLAFLIPSLVVLKKETGLMVKFGLVVCVFLIAGEFLNLVYLRYLTPTFPLFTLLISAFFVAIASLPRIRFLSSLALVSIILLNGLFFSSSGWGDKNLVDFDFDQYVKTRAPERTFVDYMNTFHPGEQVLFVGRYFPMGLRSQSIGDNWYFPENAAQLKWKANADSLMTLIKNKKIRFVISSDHEIAKRPSIARPIQEHFEKILTVSGFFLAKVREAELFSGEILLNGDFASGLKKWGHSENIKVNDAGVLVSKRNTLYQLVHVLPNEQFLVTYKMSCSSPAILRVQVNWLEYLPWASGK